MQRTFRLWRVVQSSVHPLWHRSTDSLFPPKHCPTPPSDVRQLITHSLILVILITSWDDWHTYAPFTKVQKSNQNFRLFRGPRINFSQKMSTLESTFLLHPSNIISPISPHPQFSIPADIVVFILTLLHLPPLGFHWFLGCWERAKESWDFCIGCQTLLPLS